MRGKILLKGKRKKRRKKTDREAIIVRAKGEENTTPLFC